MKVRRVSLLRSYAECPACGGRAPRCGVGHRWLRDAGVSCASLLDVVYSKHRCACGETFKLPIEHIADEGCNFTNRVKETVRALTKDGLDVEDARNVVNANCHVNVPAETARRWTDPR